jgi:hypothetical protein
MATNLARLSLDRLVLFIERNPVARLALPSGEPLFLKCAERAGSRHGGLHRRGPWAGPDVLRKPNARHGTACNPARSLPNQARVEHAAMLVDARRRFAGAPGR